MYFDKPIKANDSLSELLQSPRDNVNSCGPQQIKQLVIERYG